MENIKEYVAKKKVELRDFFVSQKRKFKLVIIQVNDDPASNAYVGGKIKDCNEICCDFEHVKLPVTTTQKQLLKVIDKFNKDKKVAAFFVQMPLPSQIDEETIKKAIIPSKDIDGFNPLSTFVPATVKGIIEFLKDNGYQFRGKNAVVLGRSYIVGKPMQKELLNLDMNVLNLHTKTSEEDKKFYIEHADLIVCAIGRKYNLDNRFNYKKDCVVFDVGINREDGKLYGDCTPDLKVAYQSPVPGGVGLLTRLAMLINFKEACEHEI